MMIRMNISMHKKYRASVNENRACVISYDASAQINNMTVYSSKVCCPLLEFYWLFHVVLLFFVGGVGMKWNLWYKFLFSDFSHYIIIIFSELQTAAKYRINILKNCWSSEDN